MTTRMITLPAQLEDAFAVVGLHCPEFTWIATPERPTLQATFVVGDMAFSGRTQDPAQFDFDASFALIERAAVADEFETIRKELGA